MTLRPRPSGRELAPTTSAPAKTGPRSTPTTAAPGKTGPRSAPTTAAPGNTGPRSAPRLALGYCSNNQKRIFQMARSRLYRGRFLQPNTHFFGIFKIYKIDIPLHRSKFKNCRFFAKFCKIHLFSVIFRDFCKMLLKSSKIGDFSSRFSQNFVGIAGNHR